MKTTAKPTRNGIKLEDGMKLTYKVDGCDESYPIDVSMINIEFDMGIDDIVLMLVTLSKEKSHISHKYDVK